MSKRMRASGTVVNVHVNRRGCSHAFHLVMTVLTLGLWLPVWWFCWVTSA